VGAHVQLPASLVTLLLPGDRHPGAERLVGAGPVQAGLEDVQIGSGQRLQARQEIVAQRQKGWVEDIDNRLAAQIDIRNIENIQPRKRQALEERLGPGVHDSL
jgi:hypothetical protein